MLRQVWVAYATATKQFYLSVPFTQGMTVQDAIDQSGLANQTLLPEELALGIFSQKVDLNTLLAAGDRVEIYRPLSINPKDIRRKRAASHPVGRYAKGNRAKP